MPEDTSERMSRRNYLRFAGAASAVALAGCAGEDVEDFDDDDDGLDGDDGTDTGNGDDGDEDNHLHIAQTQNPTTLDPHDHRETTTDNVLLQAYEFHFERDLDGNLVEGLVTDWEILDEERYWIEIREDVPFHSGEDLLPSDSAFSINRVVDADVGNLQSPQSDQLAGVTGAEVADDGHAVVLHTDGPNPMTFANLGSYCPVVQEDWIMDREAEEVAADINGTGPYQLEEFVDGEHTDFTRFADYWGGEASIETLRIDASEEASTRINSLRAGEIDIATAVPPTDAGAIEGDDDTYIADAPSTRILMLPMRYDVEPFDSQEFRQAMNYAVDFDSIIDNVLSGFGDATAQPTLEGYFGHNPDLDPYPYDPERAEELVEESGHAGVEIELHVPAGRYLQSDEIAQACVGYIDDLDNVNCEINMRDFGELAGQLLDGDITSTPPFFLIGWGNTTFDAQNNLLPWLTGGTSQYTFVDDELEELILDARTEVDEDTREQLMMDACARAHDLAVFVFLNREYLIYGLNQRVQWDPTPDEYTRAYEMSLQ
ncbi:peptide ABC transporter substrate-binding protein [Halorubrum sp. JWXQ-INN 858]|uniref:ABC transporter substrate-binding protein n=1 Tax=Halorubrum sp. JWXQ-INN 858 TaxID=2690782 RepID=UPI00135A2DCC|nr:ABC transporter substrate-binding protein [Halorubrum sp. JWXQ-INN 858]MWV64875.1 peptide ABC transporter substrate-binding protein [Halorubrum sp. JWXQ-INN 858]